MRQGKITAAFNTLLRLYRTPGLRFSTSSKLYLLKRKLEPYYEAQAEKQRVILESSGQTPTDGQYEKTPEIMKAFSDILATEIDWTDAPEEIPITEEEAQAMGITGETLDRLDGFVTFIEAKYVEE